MRTVTRLIALALALVLALVLVLADSPWSCPPLSSLILLMIVVDRMLHRMFNSVAIVPYSSV